MVLILGLFSAGLFFANGDLLVVPNNLANIEGNSGISGPFLPYFPTLFTNVPFTPIRFQQIYSASEFVGLVPNGGWISGMSFRGSAPPDGSPAGEIMADLPDIQVNFSTSGRAPDALSSTYAENVGADDTIVFGRGPLNNFWISTPGVFTGDIFFTRCFFYDPRAGNLLMDVRTYAGIPLPTCGPPFCPNPPVIDAQDIFGDSVSAAGGYLTNGTGSLSSVGLVTRFVIIPPQLTVFLTSTNLLFRWINQPGGALLEQSSVLGPGAAWQLSGGTVHTNGPYKEVTLPVDPQAVAQFFRLVFPPTQNSARGKKASLQSARSH